MDKNQKLMNRIEQARMEMFRLSKEYPLTSSKVVKASQKLDKFLNIQGNIKVS